MSKLLTSLTLGALSAVAAVCQAAPMPEDWYVADLVRVNGSHHHFKHPTKAGLVTVPHPKKDLLAKTAASILKQAGLK